MLRLTTLQVAYMSANDNSKNDIRFDDPYGGGPAATLCLDLYVRLAKLRLRRLSVGKVGWRCCGFWGGP